MPCVVILVVVGTVLVTSGAASQPGVFTLTFIARACSWLGMAA